VAEHQMPQTAESEPGGSREEAVLRAVLRVESGRGYDQFDSHTFLHRYGTADELAERIRCLGAEYQWWMQQGGYRPADDWTAMKALVVAFGRLMDLFETADQLERELRAIGYEFDTKSRTLKEVKPVGAGGKRVRGPKRHIITEAVSQAFDLLLSDGWPRQNTAELREEIRRRLTEATTFPPELLTERRIKSAVNSLLNPDRHY
jgi:hypothetical protein